jgi:hypothetical protein
MVSCMDLIETIREDIVDGLAGGEAAQTADSFAIERQPDGSFLVAYSEDAVFIVRVERRQ